jgi:DNA-binding response OmpR family regulator
MTQRVLLVDDNPDNREVLYYALEIGDFDIHQAENVAEACARLDETAFDLALLDIALPDGSGLDVAQCVREKYPRAVIIILSAIDNPAEMARSAAVGANLYVIKPFSLPQLLRLIGGVAAQTITADSKMKVVKG